MCSIKERTSIVSEQEWITVDWLEEARELLHWLSNLESGPVLLMVRHSERPEDIDVLTTIRAEITEFGLELATEFGRRLPSNWRTTIFHSPHARTTQTAERVSKGLIESGGNLIDVERLSVLLGGRGDIERIVDSAHKIGFDEFYLRWKRNELPPDTIEPIEDYRQRLDQHIHSRLSKAGPNDLHLHVTHDIVIAVARGMYLDLSVDVGLAVPFFGGFGVSYIDGELVGFNRGVQVEVTRNLFT